MTYKYFAVTMENQTPVNQQWIDDYFALSDDQFENSSNVFTIQEETFFDSKVYQDIQVRINKIVNTKTGEKVGDDYKRIIFKEPNHPTYLGRMYTFDDNYWLTINVEKIKSIAPEISVKRCNNVLKWIDTNGGYHEIPCSIDLKILENRNYSTAGSSLVLPSGVIEVVTQLNNETNLIVPNQRFLFGNPSNWSAFKVQGGGINNFNNITTLNNESVGLLRLTMSTDFVNRDTDNLELGITEYYQNNYSISIDSMFSGNVGTSFNLSPVIKFNGGTVERDVVYIVNDENIATINNGVLNLVVMGSTSVRCQLADNSLVYTDFVVDVTSNPVIEYDIRISPNTNYIYEGETQVFEVGLYKNNVLSSDPMTFVINLNTIPAESVVFTSLNDESFSIQNIEKCLTDVVSVECISGTNSKTFNFNLRGGW